MPTRLLDIRDSQRLRLKEMDGEPALYAALSHCWGDNVIIMMTTADYLSRKEHISWADLPQTFKDAIDFSQKLDLKYIWIDSLCIPQDERADWHREAAQMRNTYKNAYVTFAATASADGQGGCYRIQQYRSEKIADVKVDGSFVEVHTRRAWRHFGKEVPWKQWEDISAPLLQRAWAFQERLLSPRVIYFTTNEIMWECRTVEMCECLHGLEVHEKYHVQSLTKITNHIGHKPFKQAFSTSTTFANTRASLRIWRFIVEKYSSLSLTYSTDKLPALSGVAR
tara:strand:+ start:715 stop:1557 length:843 start_codon:yes stop_codon:yes gene_type:complete